MCSSGLVPWTVVSVIPVIYKPNWVCWTSSLFYYKVKKKKKPKADVSDKMCSRHETKQQLAKNILN